MSGFLGDVVSFVLTPVDYAVSAPLLAWHEIFASVLDVEPSLAWAMAIPGMAVTIRVLVIPLYVSQLRMRRELRQLEPQIKALEETYGHDPQLLLQERMKLVRAAGVKPLLSLLPVGLLGLVLVSLARMIDAAKAYAPSDGSFRRGFLTESDALSLSRADIGGARIADALVDGSRTETTAVAAALIAVMCVTHLIAQRQEEAVLLPSVAPTGVVEQKRQVLLYVLLFGMAAVSLVLSIGVLIFWATSKLWTVGQQRLLRDGSGG